ncbi:MAG: SEL1-like repeat protein [Gammaproteobacteria bacterium]|nr:SEL1-like repeat protein [Gammaproteobacteria bacterium]
MREWRAVVDGPPEAVVPPIYAEAHYAIATLYWRGLGVKQDYTSARKWLLLAAQLDHAPAQAKLGFMYTDGLSVSQDFGQALEWFQKAARGGSRDGLYNLGIMYLYGWGVEPDRIMAKQYLASASALGDVAAEDALQQLLAEEAAEELAHEETGESGIDVMPERSQALPIMLEELPREANARPLSSGRENPVESYSAEMEPLPSGADQAQPEAAVLEESWILAQNPSHYTIQVMALGSVERLLAVIDGYEQWSPFAIYSVANEGRPLFVLVQGVYENVEAARAARDVFPRGVQRPSQVWIRQFERIQSLISVDESG